MRNNSQYGFAISLLASALYSPAIAKKAEVPEISQTAAVEGGRSVQVIVAQSEIKSDINPSNIAAATGNGLLGALVGAAVDSARAKKAEELMVPLRNAIADFDVDALAIETGQQSFTEMEWFKVNSSVAFAKDSSESGKSALLDAATTKQVALVEYAYDMLPAFEAVRVVAKVDIVATEMLPKFKGNGKRRLNWGSKTFSGRIVSIVAMKNPNKDKEINAPLWHANKAELTRRALKIAFANLVPLTQRSLSLGDNSWKLLDIKKNKWVRIGSYVGRPQPSLNDRSTLLWWQGDFINIETIE